MADAGFWDDQETAQETVRRIKSLKAIVQPMEELAKRQGDVEAMFEMLEMGDDSAIEKELVGEISAMDREVDRIELIALLSGTHDSRDCYFNIQAGTGGADAQDWAEMMMRMYLRFFEQSGFKAEELSMKEGEEAGIQSANFIVSGPYAYGLLTCEMGVHRMERISPFNAQGKRQTSFASVDVQPVYDDIVIEIDWDKDVREDTYRASGAGGQHVNKTSSAIRLTHIESNMVVQCQNDRSQHKNRAEARKMLQAKLIQMEEAKRDATLSKIYSEKGQIGWGYRIRTYTLQPYQQVKDERTGHKTGDVQGVLDGDLQPFIDAELRRKAKKR
jgi:peptide chain release factor 2